MTSQTAIADKNAGSYGLSYPVKVCFDRKAWMVKHAKPPAISTCIKEGCVVGAKPVVVYSSLL